MFKKAISMAITLTMSASLFTAPLSVRAQEKIFDPQTVMWTDNFVEEALKEESNFNYANAAEVDPNASSKESSGHQNPYGKPGETLTGWAYSEYIWTHGYPVGNGRMAAMVAGGIDKEVIQVNEDTIWDGSPYGTIQDENGTTITNISQTKDAQTITTVNQTGGSKENGWTYFRGADQEGNPAPIGAADVTVGDAAFRSSYPQFASSSITNQALNVDNAETQEAVQKRYQMERMVEETVLGNPSGQKAYKSFVELYLDFNQEHAKAQNYTKSLDMKTGVVTVDYNYDGARFTRETFASYPDQVVATNVKSDKELNFSAQLHSYHNQTGYYTFEKVNDKDIKITASVYNGNKNNATPASVNVIQFEAHMLLDGTGTFTVSPDNTTVTVTGGKEASIYIVGASNYQDYLNIDNTKPARDCAIYVNNIKEKSYQEIKEQHLADFEPLFAATSISLDNVAGVDYSNTPTDERVRKNINGKSGFTVGAGSNMTEAAKNSVRTTYSDGDNQLAALEFNFGKYLLISGSRDGRAAEDGTIAVPESQPLNLTGKWNAALSASWKGKYTVNINTEMNYWAAQPLGLASCERPLIDTFRELAQSGAITAANQYAIYNGRGDGAYQPGDPWVMHHNFDLWRGTQPIDNATAGLWPTGGIWLIDHAWQYYQFTNDREYLAEVYPFMTGAAEFFTQFLVKDPKTGYLITAASCSPEQGGVQPGPAMDTQLIRNLYDMVEKASVILGKNQEQAQLLAKIKQQMPATYLGNEKGKLAPNLVDNGGLIKEWVRGDVAFDLSTTEKGTWTVTNPFKGTTTGINKHTASNNSGHRHCSHLWELYPGTHLSAYSEEENEAAIYRAFQNSVAARGAGSGQGWGLAWRIALNARALDGDKASQMLEQLFTTRTSPDLIDQHPNFQIDGNYGATAGILEMLLQSHDGAIDVLPALPSQWKSGSFTGFKARGDVSVSAQWADGAATQIQLTPVKDGELKVRNAYLGKAVIQDSSGKKVASSLNKGENLRTFQAKAGETYTVTELGKNEPPILEGTWTTKVSDATGFFNTEGGRAPQLENSNANVGYVCNNAYDTGITDKAVGSVGFAYPNCDVSGLTKLSLNVARKAKAGSQYVSVRLDGKDGTEIASGQIIASSYAYLDMPVTLPQDVTGKHSLYLVFTSIGSTTDKYIANVMELKGTYEYKNPNYQTCAAILKPTVSGNGILVKAQYSEAGVLELLETEAAQVTAGQELRVEAPEGTKVMLWDSLGNMKPMAVSAAAVKEDGNDPQPSTPPTTPPVEKGGVFIGTTEYESIRSALKAVDAAPPKSEAERVVIDLMPGLYREQLVVNSPYVTMRKKPGTEGEVICTWYYATGSMYTSCGSDGFYQEGKTSGEKGIPKNWGATLSLTKGAHDFIGENIRFENSYNLYYTQEELNDGLETDPDPNNSMFDRYRWIMDQKKAGTSDEEINSWLQSRTEIPGYKIGGTKEHSPRERACAFNSSADRVVMRNCNIVSKQDAIGINNNRVYFEDCTLEGGTDYICGSAIAVMNNCTLRIGSGPAMDPERKKTDGACITAAAQSQGKGYVFYNCEVTGTEWATPSEFGRPWNANAEVVYIHTKINKSNRPGYTDQYLISDKAWTNMSDTPYQDARFAEYRSTDGVTGAEIPINDATRRGMQLDQWTMLEYNPYNYMKGTDGWDPAGMAEYYAGFDQVVEDITFDTSGTGNFALPDAPQGYEFYWASDSAYAEVDNEAKQVKVVRPAYGEPEAKAKLTVYVRKPGTEYGVRSSTVLTIPPVQDTEGTFTVEGTVSLLNPMETEATAVLQFMQGEKLIKTEEVLIPAGETSVPYSAQYIPEGDYQIVISTPTEGCTITSEKTVELSGTAGSTQTLDITMAKLTLISLSTEDFSEDWATPALINPVDGFHLDKVTGTTEDTANIGDGNTVYRMTKEDGVTVANTVGASWNLADMVAQNGGTLENTDIIQFSYDFLLEKAKETDEEYPSGYMASEYSFFDLTTGLGNGDSKANPARFARWGVHYGWNQFNMFDAGNTKINGDKTQFDKNNTMENRWYRIVADVDLKNQTITTTLYDRDKDMEILNKKAFTIAQPLEDGSNPGYPTAIDLSKLYFALYADKKGDTVNKIEFYVDNLSLSYYDFE